MLDRLLFWRRRGSRLTRAMRRVATNDSPAARRVLHLELLKSNLMLPKPSRAGDPGRGARLTLVSGAEIAVFTAEAPGGKQAMLAFTDPGALLAWKPAGSDYLALRVQDACSLVAPNDLNGLIINPAGPVGGHLSRFEADALAEGAVPELGPEANSPLTALLLPTGSRAIVGPPSRPGAQELAERIIKLLEPEESIVQAYLFETAIGRGERHLAVGLIADRKLTPDRERAMVAEIAGAAGSIGEAGDHVDLVFLEEGQFLETVRATVAPVMDRRGPS